MTAEEHYKAEVGYDAYHRQQSALADRCPHCWAMPGQPHVTLCPNYEEPEPQPALTESLF